MANDVRKVILLGGLVLTILTLTAGLTIFNIVQRQTESLLSASLELALQNKIQLFEYQIAHGLYNTQVQGRRQSLIQNLELIQTPSRKKKGLAGLKKIANQMFQDNFSGIVIYDHNAIEVMHAGRILQLPAPIVHLKTNSSIKASLILDHQIILQTWFDVMNLENQFIGRIMTEQPLTGLDQIFKGYSPIGETDDFMLCGAVEKNHLKMDCFLRGIDEHEFKRIDRIMSDEPLPMHYALEGRFGVKFAKDYRQKSVVAAHSPVAYGLGAVLKFDQKELYYPITKQLDLILLFLTAFVLCGISILYWLMMLVANKLISSEQKTQDANKALQHAKDKAEQVSAELASYIDAIGNLNLISIIDRRGRILQANKKFCEVSGYSKKELIGQTHRILDSGKHPDSFFVNIWKTIVRGKIWYGEICNRRKDGALYWVDAAIVPIKDENKQIVRFVFVRIDITARKQMGIALKEQLKKSNCIQAIRHEMESNRNLDTLCQQILQHLIPAMQYPDITSAAIEMNGERFIAGNCHENHTYRLTAEIAINQKKHGQLSVFYAKKELFQLENRLLLATIADDLANWIERKQNEELILDMATHDSLTGLPNRRLLQDRIKQILAHGQRAQTHAAVLFIDLDHFKIINDSLGHDIGDLLLKEVTARITSCVRMEDTIARQGGDEFIAVLHSITKTQDAALQAQKILDKLSLPFQIQNEELHIGASIGIAIFPDNGTDADTLLRNSDIAMYHAKSAGRNNFQFFTERMNQLVSEKHALGTELRHALERNELELYFQPVMKTPSLKTESIEVLLRWHHPKYGLVLPSKFITLAEESGLIIPIGKWILRTACLQIKRWQRLGYQVPRLSINISARQFRDKLLIDNIAHILKETGVDARFLSLEITESMIVDNVDNTIQTLNQLNKMGVEIAIDDFGTGYSSLSYLKRFPIKTLKIDRAFVRDIITDPSDNAIVSAIIAMTNSLEMNVIAEGVETEDQLNLLAKHGCNRFQGNYFSKPLPATEIVNYLDKHQIYLVENTRQAR